ncbi:hypothetical protein PC116_g2809 [Phytophthora cactorum]|uniref:Uncharacterized protein n=1 Tax=Phytophthora cactorum TaxID=29920 RepID=A0A8T1LNS8_9STRA|nr:hypothetical protein PC117_g17562 [Phytophthora cactorum]KAG2933438.1 hypothetical protein PC114_g1398 [Phytophthora cactorum]KAG3029865.1 hypothetical protein PC120_g4070 [Phytophthora cactorum]KAG3191771.1 hypothetical protein C6341_g1021 [Phytophthora cactorum]KAG3193939.1 hypothetical protein PC128_g9803 [Phytophthora cactorum]
MLYSSNKGRRGVLLAGGLCINNTSSYLQVGKCLPYLRALPPFVTNNAIPLNLGCRGHSLALEE